MPRLPRVQPADVPQHIVQRGNNRSRCFFEDVDYLSYLHWLRTSAMSAEVRIHAYALMPNHVHLLASPGKDDAIARMMQCLGRNYAGSINKRYGRTGTLWEKRYRANLVETETYLLEVYRYIDLNPVRAGLVNDAKDYRWSSARANLGLERQFIVMHPLFENLGADKTERAAGYRALLGEASGSDCVERIRSALSTGQALGSTAFRDQIEAECGQRVTHTTAGRRPRLKADSATEFMSPGRVR